MAKAMKGQADAADEPRTRQIEQNQLLKVSRQPSKKYAARGRTNAGSIRAVEKTSCSRDG